MDRRCGQPSVALPDARRTKSPHPPPRGPIRRPSAWWWFDRGVHKVGRGEDFDFGGPPISSRFNVPAASSLLQPVGPLARRVAVDDPLREGTAAAGRRHRSLPRQHPPPPARLRGAAPGRGMSALEAAATDGGGGSTTEMAVHDDGTGSVAAGEDDLEMGPSYLSGTCDRRRVYALSRVRRASRCAVRKLETDPASCADSPQARVREIAQTPPSRLFAPPPNLADECAICLSPPVDPTRLPCGHHFCRCAPRGSAGPARRLSAPRGRATPPPTLHHTSPRLPPPQRVHHEPADPERGRRRLPALPRAPAAWTGEALRRGGAKVHEHQAPR